MKDRSVTAFWRSGCRKPNLRARRSYPPFSASRALTPRRSAYSINASSMTAVIDRRSDSASCSARASTDGSKRVVNGFFIIVAFRLELGAEKMHNKARAVHMHSACYDRSRCRKTLIDLTTTALSEVRIMADSDNTTTLPLVIRRRGYLGQLQLLEPVFPRTGHSNQRI